jgi:hypothetical protein
VNATALAIKVNALLDNFGNNVTYYAPVTTATYNTEGDEQTVWQITTVGSRFVQSGNANSNIFTEMGRFNLREGEAVMKNDLTIHLRGKIVSNGVSWEITKFVDQVRIKDRLLLNIVELKNILP